MATKRRCTLLRLGAAAASRGAGAAGAVAPGSLPIDDPRFSIAPSTLAPRRRKGSGLGGRKAGLRTGAWRSSRAARAATSSSRARTTWTPTGEPGTPMLAVGLAPRRCAPASSSTPRNRAARRRRRGPRRVLTDAAGEDQRVEPAERRGQRAHRAGDAVREHRRERAAPARRASRSPHVRRAGEGEQPRLALERVLELLGPGGPLAQQVEHDLGSIEPERVAIGTPSSGEKPIVVSTERPSSTAVAEQPPPRWSTTSRGTGTCSAAHCTESPWNP